MHNFRGGMVLASAQVYDGNNSIWLDNVVCRGNETSLDRCAHLPYGINDCDHTEDVGVRCGMYYNQIAYVACIFIYKYVFSSSCPPPYG